MWRIVLFTGINATISLLNGLFLRIPGLELTPAAMVLIAQGGESVPIGAVLLTLSYMVPQPRRFSMIWIHLPSALLAGWIALHVANGWVAVAAYHAVSFCAIALTGTLTGYSLLFFGISLCVNLAVLQIVSLFS